jgi:hypothetical protein
LAVLELLTYNDMHLILIVGVQFELTLRLSSFARHSGWKSEQICITQNVVPTPAATVTKIDNDDCKQARKSKPQPE